MAAICRHRGQVIPCVENQKTLRCPLHFWTYDLEGKLIGAPRMDKEEILKLREHLRRALGAPSVNVTPSAREKGAADVTLGERKIGLLTADEEDGDRSFFFEMKIPVERAALQA